MSLYQHGGPSACKGLYSLEGQAGKGGVSAGRAAADAQALLVGLALSRQVLGRVAAVVHVHDAPVLAEAVAVLPPVPS